MSQLESIMNQSHKNKFSRIYFYAYQLKKIIIKNYNQKCDSKKLKLKKMFENIKYIDKLNTSVKITLKVFKNFIIKVKQDHVFNFDEYLKEIYLIHKNILSATHETDMLKK